MGEGRGEALKLQPHHQREVAARFGHVDEAVVAGVVVVALVQQVVGMQRHFQGRLPTGEVLACRSIQRPVTVGRFLGRYNLVLCSHDVGIQTGEAFALPFERVLQRCILHKGEPIPRYYQEAACLYTVTQPPAPVEVPIDEGIQKSLQAFMQLLQQYDGMSLEQVRSALSPMYGDTYFFEYFLTDDLNYM